MICIECKNKTKVTNSRKNSDGTRVWRRHKCQSCSAIFTTQETVDPISINVLKRNGTVERFSQAKLFLSLHKALEGHITTEDIDQITSNLKAQLVMAKKPIATTYISTKAAGVISGIEKGAAVRYSSYH